MRGEEIEEGEVESARLRRGGREGRKRRARMERESKRRRGEPEEQCQDAPASMPMVQRAQYDNTEQRLHNSTRSRRMRAG